MVYGSELQDVQSAGSWCQVFLLGHSLCHEVMGTERVQSSEKIVGVGDQSFNAAARYRYDESSSEKDEQLLWSKSLVQYRGGTRLEIESCRQRVSGAAFFESRINGPCLCK